MQLTEHAVLLILIDVGVGIWAAVQVARRGQQRTARGARHHARPGDRWRAAAAALTGVALAGHLGRLALRELLSDAQRGGDGLSDAFSALLSVLLLVSRLRSGAPSRNHLPAAAMCCCQGTGMLGTHRAP